MAATEKPPIFVIGPTTRCGTSLLQRLLNSTGKAVVYGENFALLQTFPDIIRNYQREADAKRKVIAIYRELQNEGLPAELFQRVHAPVGLDIGAVTPEEIAVAITAELIAMRRHSEAALPHLRYQRQTEAQPVSPAENEADVQKK